MKNKVYNTVKKYNMISASDTVLVALSGGADSVSLLHILLSLKNELGFNIAAAHVNHMIRGKEADRDELFVRSLCDKLNISLKIGRFNIPEISKKTGESEELCGRRKRYEFFEQTAPGAKIATAHNLNDCAETFFLNLSRGAGLKGLTGIPPVRGNIISPLIECERDEIENYCYENRLAFVTDSTNLSDDYTRNKIRHSVLPVMNEINPSFFSVFLRNTDSLKEDMLYIEKEVNRAYNSIPDKKKIDISFLLGLDRSIRNRVLSKLITENTSLCPELRHIDIINTNLQNGFGALTLSSDFTVKIEKEFLLFKSNKNSFKSVHINISSKDFIYKTPYGEIEFVLLNKKLSDLKKNIKELSLDNYADYDKIVLDSCIRTRENSDRFTYVNAAHSSSLKNLYRDKKIDSEQRKDKIFIADSAHILWSEVFGTSKYASVDNNTKKIVKIIFRRNLNA